MDHPAVLVGYLRGSNPDQSFDQQHDALRAAGCERVFSDVASGAKAARPGLAEAPGLLRRGDTLVVWRLDRLGRSLGHLIETVATLERRGRGLRSLQESLGTTTSGGRLIFHLFGALAEFERELIRARTCHGLKSARTGQERRAAQAPGREESRDGPGPPRRQPHPRWPTSAAPWASLAPPSTAACDRSPQRHRAALNRFTVPLLILLANSRCHQLQIARLQRHNAKSTSF